MSAFAKQLQRHQKRLGYTDEQMCRALAVGNSTFRSWRTGDPQRVPLAITQEGALARLRAAKRPRKQRGQNAEVSDRRAHSNENTTGANRRSLH